MPDDAHAAADTSARLDPEALLASLKRLLPRLEDDLRAQCEAHLDLQQGLEREYREARAAGRTAEPFGTWREAPVTQAAVAWILAGVFLRFCEDNGLIPEPWLAGPGPRRQQARDRREQYFHRHPAHSDRDYLQAAFAAGAALPGLGEVLDRAHNPLWRLPVSGDMAGELLAFWQRVNPDTGRLDHDFTNPAWNTRFLGDLYQDLSEADRKRYALLQTPRFVEAFILDRTLEPAIETFGLETVRCIDPTCGSGHFLIGAFERLFDHWQRTDTATAAASPGELARRALAALAGVDINPAAAAIARFRLLVAALKAAGVGTLKEAPDFHIAAAAGDSLLHGPRPDQLDLGPERAPDEYRHCYAAEDAEALHRILRPGHYHAVVGNPPYITVKDKALNALYRQRYATCHRQYSLVVPFTERFFQLAVHGDRQAPPGYVGMINANSFMKREFGKKLIEEFFASVELSHVIDTSGAYIPGHGTPTVILFGCHRTPVTSTVRTVQGIRGEPGTPADAAHGKVWTAILEQVDRPGSEGMFVSVADLPRESFGKHPWSLGGGGASELVETIDQSSSKTLGDSVFAIGFVCITKADDVFEQPSEVLRRHAIPASDRKEFGIGEEVRDWGHSSDLELIWPYDEKLSSTENVVHERTICFMWPWRTILWDRKVFGGSTYRQVGKAWTDYGQIPIERYRIPLSITFADVATHNHFVLDRGGKVFNRTAPVIKLPAGATEDNHLGLLGLLNSSTACFWLKQVCHNKGSTVDSKGARQTTDPFENFYQFNGTRVGAFPIAESRPLSLARHLDTLARERQAHLPSSLTDRLPLPAEDWHAHRARANALLARMIAAQEELDWQWMGLYGITDRDLNVPGATEHPEALTDEALPPLRLGERAFEIVLARRMAAGEEESTWFARHGSTPVTEPPEHWPAAYRALVERRIAAIESERDVGLIERPEYKRRWNQTPWDELAEDALRGWLLDRLEAPVYWPEPRPRTAAEIARQAETDADFLAVAELYVGGAGFDVARLVAELVESEAVPFLPVLRLKPPGLRKRAEWERVWELQRREDAIDAEVRAATPRLPGEDEATWKARCDAVATRRKRDEVGEIPVPPKYRSADFQTTGFWRLRGPLDVPKERFIGYPHCGPADDGSLHLGWAGWDHLQQTQALAARLQDAETRDGWPPERFAPLLAGLDQLLPWVRQWHGGVDPHYGQDLAEFFAGYLHDELGRHGLTLEAVRAWQPPARRRGRRRAR